MREDVRCARARDGAFKVKVNSGGEAEQSFDFSRSPPLTGEMRDNRFLDVPRAIQCQSRAQGK